jgi:hypothetical protein
MDKETPEVTNNEVKTEFVSTNEMHEDLHNNPNAMTMEDREEGLPDMEALTGQILEFLQFKDEPEIVTLAKEKYGAFLNMVDQRFPAIPGSIIKMLMDEDDSPDVKAENVIRLLETLKKLNDVKQGKVDLKTAEDQFNEGVNQRWLYPDFGGKEGYEEHIAKLEKKTKRKARKQAKRGNFTLKKK